MNTSATMRHKSSNPSQARASAVVAAAEDHVREVMHARLPPTLTFHNLAHTLDVLAAVRMLSAAQGVARSKAEALELAALFHDLGHVERYRDHETVSTALAAAWLTDWDYPRQAIALVCRLIGATRMPQSPTTELESIICDADLAHLASEHYCVYEAQLRVEWSAVLGINQSDELWRARNRDFLRGHHYRSRSGRRILEPLKRTRGALATEVATGGKPLSLQISAQ